MRIKNKYLRNRRFRIKNWKRIRNTKHPFETYCPYDYFLGEYRCNPRYSYEEQIKSNFEDIDNAARALEQGKRVYFNAHADYRRNINRRRKSKERHALIKINMGEYDVEIPRFKKNANWEYF